MGQQVDFVAFDGAAVPVSRALTADGIERDPSGLQLAIWRELSLATSLNLQTRLSFKKQKLKSGTYVSTLDLVCPVAEILTGGTQDGYTAPPKAAFEDRVLIIQYAHPRSTTAGRRMARQLALNLAGGITTSVTPSLLSQWALLADNLVFPS